jgi:hypothetical protein
MLHPFVTSCYTPHVTHAYDAPSKVWDHLIRHGLIDTQRDCVHVTPLNTCRRRALILGGDHLIEDCHCWCCVRCNASFR